MNIVLLKEPKGSHDPYSIMLRELGTVQFIPVLSIKLINMEELKNAFSREKFNSIIFTSGNAVRAVKAVLQSSASTIDITLIKCYVVGKATNKLASELGFECSGSDCGNAEELAKLIIKETTATDNNKFLFPCGQMKRETLPLLLRKAGMDLTCVTVYETGEHLEIMESITKYKGLHDDGVMAVFFSPSGVNFSVHKFRTVYGEDMRGVHCAAIGKATSEALQKNGITPCCVAEQPTPQDLLTAIKSCNETC